MRLTYPYSKIDVWKILQLSNRILLEESIEEAATVALLIGIPRRDSFFVVHYMKELMVPREGLHGMMQFYRRQHFAASNDLHEHLRGNVIVEGIYEDEIHEHSDGIFKDAIGTG